MHVRGSLTRSELAAFLEDAAIPVRVACETPAGNRWMVSLWYRLRPIGGDDGDVDERDDRSIDSDADDTVDSSKTTGDTDDWVLQCATEASADVVSYLTEDPAVAFEVSTNHPPYRGVRGRGTASIEPDPEKETLRSLLERYLGGTDSALARGLLREEREEVRITIDPDVVYGWDYSDRMREFDGEAE